MRSLYASATRVNSTGELILKVVNASERELATNINVQGMPQLAGPARATVLTSSKPTDENSLEHPTRVAPVSSTLDFLGSTIHHAFPGNSVTVLRIRPE